MLTQNWKMRSLMAFCNVSREDSIDLRCEDGPQVLTWSAWSLFASAHPSKGVRGGSHNAQERETWCQINGKLRNLHLQDGSAVVIPLRVRLVATRNASDCVNDHGTLRTYFAFEPQSQGSLALRINAMSGC